MDNTQLMKFTYNTAHHSTVARVYLNSKSLLNPKSKPQATLSGFWTFINFLHRLLSKFSNTHKKTPHAYIFSTPEKQIELGLDGAQLTQFQTYLNQFADDMKAYLDPAQRTKVITQQIHDDYKTINSWIGHLRTGIKASKRDTLTDQDYASLFIHKDKTTRTKHTEIDSVPTLEVKSQSGGTLTLGVFVAGSEIPIKPKLPEFVKNIELFWCFDENQNPPINITQHNQTFATASPKIIINKADEGQYCHLIAYFILPNGTKSQPSQVLSFIASTI